MGRRPLRVDYSDAEDVVELFFRAFEIYGDPITGRDFMPSTWYKCTIKILKVEKLASAADDVSAKQDAEAYTLRRLEARGGLKPQRDSLRRECAFGVVRYASLAKSLALPGGSFYLLNGLTGDADEAMPLHPFDCFGLQETIHSNVAPKYISYSTSMWPTHAGKAPSRQDFVPQQNAGSFKAGRPVQRALATGICQSW